MRTLFLSLLCASFALAQTGARIINPVTVEKPMTITSTGELDGSFAAKTKPTRVGTSAPTGACDPGEAYLHNKTAPDAYDCNSAGAWVKRAGSGGSGLTHGTYYVTDNGTKYLSDHMAYAATSPPTTGWSWFSVGGNSTQDSASYTSTGEGVLRMTTGGSTYPDIPHFLSRIRTGTSLTVALDCATGMNVGNGAGVGGCWVGLGHASTGGYITISWDGNSGDNWYVHVSSRFDDGTTHAHAGVFIPRPPRFMRVVLTGGDASFWVSNNGIDFKSVWNETLGSNISPADVWLVGAHSVNSGNQGPNYMAVDSFVEQ